MTIDWEIHCPSSGFSEPVSIALHPRHLSIMISSLSTVIACSQLVWVHCGSQSLAVLWGTLQLCLRCDAIGKQHMGQLIYICTAPLQGGLKWGRRVRILRTMLTKYYCRWQWSAQIWLRWFSVEVAPAGFEWALNRMKNRMKNILPAWDLRNLTVNEPMSGCAGSTVVSAQVVMLTASAGTCNRFKLYSVSISVEMPGHQTSFWLGLSSLDDFHVSHSINTPCVMHAP